MTPGSPGYTGCVEACAQHKATLLRDRKHQMKRSTITTGYMERILADPGVLPVENHEEGGFSEYIVFCVPCNSGVILGSAWNLGPWRKCDEVGGVSWTVGSFGEGRYAALQGSVAYRRVPCSGGVCTDSGEHLLALQRPRTD
ncbi:hypothetical protein DFP72DRAFT_857915 [Ephemerocybe angulata]|uniref:Uncharacterized protein n=1 Tax=Ephemerocybe angulata TaxID=980116 RepID=A0A8H6HE08_9AGAR|nr:hypothetical protein DFP72DRAFT_857915 [Tulosesus angulatus]